jgi:hypothetical protein
LKLQIRTEVKSLIAWETVATSDRKWFGRVTKGWDEGVMEMALGENSIFTILGHMAYGHRGFPGPAPT